MRRLVAPLALWLAIGSSVAAAEPDWEWLIVADGPTAPAERRALAEALRLLPRLPARVAVIDATEARPDVRQTLLALDAFVVRGSHVVYVTRQSRLLEGAVARSAFHVHALATVLWHEVAHAEGFDERQARKREEALWASFIRDGRVDQVMALRYLNALATRADDQVLASR